MGHAAQKILVTPKDQYRFGYRLWLDENTAMPLKTQLCDSRGQVIEQILFARLDMPDSIPDSDLAPGVHTQGMRWVRDVYKRQVIGGTATATWVRPRCWRRIGGSWTAAMKPPANGSTIWRTRFACIAATPS